LFGGTANINASFVPCFAFGAVGRISATIRPAANWSNNIPQRRMSAFGTKRTSRRTQSMSAFGGKADIQSDPLRCLLLTQGGHSILGIVATQNDGRTPFHRLEIPAVIRALK